MLSMNCPDSTDVQVDYNAKTEYDAVNNYKVLQAALLKLGVDKVSALCLDTDPFQDTERRRSDPLATLHYYLLNTMQAGL